MIENIYNIYTRRYIVITPLLSENSVPPVSEVLNLIIVRRKKNNLLKSTLVETNVAVNKRRLPNKRRSPQRMKPEPLDHLYSPELGPN